MYSTVRATATTAVAGWVASLFPRLASPRSTQAATSSSAAKLQHFCRLMVPQAATAPGPRQAPLEQRAVLLLSGDVVPWLCIPAAAAGFLNLLDTLVVPAASSPVSDGVSPFNVPGKQQQQALVHALPVHAVSPHGVKFATEQQQQQQAYPEPLYGSPHLTTSFVESLLYADSSSQQQQHTEEHAQEESDREQELAYLLFKFPTEKMHFASDLRSLIEMSAPSASALYDVEMSTFNSYASEFSVQFARASIHMSSSSIVVY
ncbi:hypothetical protein DFH08DRAFT_812884 [Mycena albidolilacea]|uniref:Uncharacterized protein n=1 Tax=Mycena albidolilacea TaxID=1033008 RepID=A0AAD7EMB9_9AGAR|nr:hypothetical protein DFH08DRAFT_812884 [Mycena albidolilacea]